MNLTGKYTGYYEYTHGYQIPYFGQRVKLFVTLEDNNATLTGNTTEEESEFAVPHSGTIRGFYENTYISFVKTYPVRPIISELNNTIEVHQGELEIEHEGFIDEENNAIYGVWRIHTDPKILESNENVPNFVEGIWMIKRDGE